MSVLKKALRLFQILKFLLHASYAAFATKSIKMKLHTPGAPKLPFHVVAFTVGG
jgi:hypothetical protein